MRINDYRHHAQPQTLARLAEGELRRLANIAATMFGHWRDKQRHEQRNRERLPDAFGNKPGAMIERHCSPEQREILKHLQSGDHVIPFEGFYLDDWDSYFTGDPRKGRPTYGFGYHGWALEPPTIWTFKHRMS